MFLANLRLGCYSLFSNPQNQLCLTPPLPPRPLPPSATPKQKLLFSNALKVYSPLKNSLRGRRQKGKGKGKEEFGRAREKGKERLQGRH